MSLVGRRIDIRGTRQGAGFRPWVFGLAPAEPARRFTIDESAAEGQRRASIPPDLPTCADCLREILDPGDRRYRYPFTSCANCGPRFTILRDLPYDRAATSMASCAMCAECRKEYDSPADRRFHAQPNACPACGPRLRALSARHEAMPSSDAISAAAAFLDADLIVAIKGIGGYHLACDATSSTAVSRLRHRKRRDHTPFAVMVRDIAAAEAVARLGTGEKALLTSAERPIVLVPRREDAGLAPEAAPGNPLVGLLLPYSPLDHLLLAEMDRPLVMTSGSLSGEPLARTDAEAFERLAGIADVFLLHDREIETRCDDSVAHVVTGRPMLLRRSRGYVPRPILMARPFAQPVLACGGHLTNAFCIGVGDAAYFGPHVGDLENPEDVQAFEEAVERLQRLLGVRPEVVAHDLHPGCLSTAYALDRPGPFKLGVRRHHAHVVSAMAEHGLRGSVLGVAYDGTGYGADGSVWGGEILLADETGSDGLATFRPVRLPGGEATVRQVWRIALALLDDAFDGRPPIDDVPLFRALSRDDIAAVRSMIAAGLAPLAHGVGRYFDALGALVLGRARSHHQGDVALEWNLAADPAEAGEYPFALDQSSSPRTLDTRPLVRAVVEDLRAGRGAAVISGRFHNTLAAATAAVVRAGAESAGRLPVVLSGGCFENALLAERTLSRLAPDFVVYLHREVPPGDGGLALGQAVIADALTRCDGS